MTKKYFSKNRLYKVSNKKQKGAILLVIILVVSGLATLATAYVTTSIRNTTLVDNILQKSQLRYTALSGIEYATYLLESRNRDLIPESDGSIYTLFFDDTNVKIRVMPEAGKIDINTANNEILETIFLSYGLGEEEAKQLAINIIHWRNGQEVSSDFSISDDDYESAGLPIPAHRRFYAVDEVANVMGVNGSIYQYLKDIITVYGSTKISAYIAPRAVLFSLGLSERQIELVISARNDYYINGTDIPENILLLSKFLIGKSGSRYYRIESIAKKNNNEIGVYIVFKKRIENYQYQVVESGLLSDDDLKQFKSIPINDIEE